MCMHLHMKTLDDRDKPNDHAQRGGKEWREGGGGCCLGGELIHVMSVDIL